MPSVLQCFPEHCPGGSLTPFPSPWPGSAGSHAGLDLVSGRPRPAPALMPLDLPPTLGVLFDQNCFQHTNSATRDLEVPKHFLFLSSRLPCISVSKWGMEGSTHVFWPKPQEQEYCMFMFRPKVIFKSPKYLFSYKHFVDFSGFHSVPSTKGFLPANLSTNWPEPVTHLYECEL